MLVVIGVRVSFSAPRYGHSRWSGSGGPWGTTNAWLGRTGCRALVLLLDTGHGAGSSYFVGVATYVTQVTVPAHRRSRHLRDRLLPVCSRVSSARFRSYCRTSLS